MDQQLINEKQQENSAMEHLNLWLWVEALCFGGAFGAQMLNSVERFDPKAGIPMENLGWKSRQALHWGNVWNMHEYA